MSVWVTPTLLAGLDPPPDDVLAERCRNAPDAAAVIVGGRRAWLELDDWDATVHDILVAVGASPAWASRQVHAARTGILLDEESFTA
jgi:hypothetical protein